MACYHVVKYYRLLHELYPHRSGNVCEDKEGLALVMIDRSQCDSGGGKIMFAKPQNMEKGNVAQDLGLEVFWAR